jgi:hypothetical protein
MAQLDERLGRLMLGGQQDGSLRVDLPARWMVHSLFWLLAAAGDGIELGSSRSPQSMR